MMNKEPPLLLPKELRETIPQLYATENTDDPTVQAKLFTPWAGWTWFVTEFDGEDTCFGLVSGHAVELGYFSLAELASLKGPGGLRIERDVHFTPRPLSEVRTQITHERGSLDGLEVHENTEPYGNAPPSPITQPGIRLVETRLASAELTPHFGAVAVPADAARVLHHLIGGADREHFATLLLNARHRITHAHIASCGSLTSAPVHPREVFKAAVMANAAAVIIGHNHPSGEMAPSPDDIAVDERMEQAGKLLGIVVLDSLIVGPGNEFHAKTLAQTCLLPTKQTKPLQGRPSTEAQAACRDLLQDINEVLERQGENWWDETVTAGRHNRSRAEALLGLTPYRVHGNEPEAS